MPPPSDSLPGLPNDYTTKYFGNDVVTKYDDPKFQAKVLRCWADEDGVLPPLPEGQESHPLDRLLKRGEVGITNLANGELSIVPESTLELYQREFLKGDIVKRSLEQAESAVVCDTETEVRLQHVITGEELDGWIPYQKLGNSLKIEARDRVIYDQWIGTVEEVFEDALVESGIGVCYRLAEMGGLLEPGKVAADALPKDAVDLQLSTPLPPFANPSVDKIIDVRPVIVYVTWNAINQLLPISEQEKHPEPPKFWSGAELKKLTHFDGTRSQPPPIGSSVRFKNEADEKAYGVKSTMHVGGTLQVKLYKVIESRSTVKLRWQTGEETRESASELVPYRNIDDYESWPGEHIVWRGDNDQRRAAVVQRFDPHQRVAELLFPDANETQLVPVLELDPGGREGSSHYGVSFGQPVLLCEKNGSTPPEVPVLGQTETPVDHMWWRNELAKLAEEYVEDSNKFGEHLPEGDTTKIDWYGEVTQLHLDGSIDVALPNGDVKRVGIQNVYLLNEPHSPDLFDELGPIGPGMEGDGMMFDDDWLGDQLATIDEQMEMEVGSTASWETMHEDGGDGVTPTEERQEVDDQDAKEERQVELIVPTATVSSGTSPITPIFDIPPLSEAGPGPSTMTNGHASITARINGNGEVEINGAHGIDRHGDDDDEKWTQFEMLEEAPKDHYFMKEPRLDAASKQYHSRLQKEHRALMSSLPENILVRTYEDRTDLMRVLIIGPEGTPYANAPFIFDVYLNPTKFPHEPPLVHFHSHTNGHGRCNPNLYEDGKVCLSILGTWSGEKSESWNPSKSSLLQVFVSISGLVLVRSPYHCEPAFARLEGTREGKINSRLYSEKAYVLSRSFVRTALERPPSSLADEIRYFYLTRGKLRDVIDHAQKLIDKGQKTNGNPPEEEEEEDTEMWSSGADVDVMGSLTMGAVITLRRTLPALERMWNAGANASTG